MVEEFVSADGGNVWPLHWGSSDGFSVDTGDFFTVGAGTSAYPEFVVASSAVDIIGAVCSWDWATVG